MNTKIIEQKNTTVILEIDALEQKITTVLLEIDALEKIHRDSWITNKNSYYKIQEKKKELEELKLMAISVGEQ